VAPPSPGWRGSDLSQPQGWLDIKTTPELRPLCHRLEQRIRAHLILCWLALLRVIIETTTGDTWNRLREDLQELHVGTFEGIELGPPATS